MKKALLLFLLFVSFVSNEAISQCGQISLIGEFNSWGDDYNLTRDALNPNLWRTTISLTKDMAGGDTIVEMKFREDSSWTVNWGAATFPVGIGVLNGPNIPVPIDTTALTTDYFVTFNCSTGEYSYTELCGEISLIGEFNGWLGDLAMTRNTDNPALWTANITLTAESNSEDPPDIIYIKFREDSSWTVNWGAVDFPSGIGVLNGSNIPVPLDVTATETNYIVTFNCVTGEYNFVNTTVTAPKVSAITIDGNLDETDWKIDQIVVQIVNGMPGNDINKVLFGVAYNADYLYIGLSVKDAFLTLNEMGEVFIDGNKSGGAYDEFDLHLRFAGPYVQVVYPDTIIGIQLGFGINPLGDGYTAELGIPWSELGVTPVEGAQIGFDLIISDGDSGTGIDYMMAWVGGLQDYMYTSSFGNLLFGTLSGVDEIKDYSAFVVLFPNPSNNNVYLNLANDVFYGNVNVYVTDMVGRVLQNNRLNFQSTGDQILLNVNQLTPGIYFVNIYGDNGSRAVKKLIVQ